MKTGRKLFTGTLLALCAILLVLCALLAAGWNRASKTAAGAPDVRNNGTAIQWKYADGDEWHDLVSIAELRGADGTDGKDGIDGKDGTDGKDGVDGKNGADGINGKDGAAGKSGADGKSIEVKTNDTHIQWRFEDGEWQDLVALSDLTGPSGRDGENGANGKSPEFRVDGSTLQWRYTGDTIWLNLYDLSVLKGLDGKDGADGRDGIDGINGRDGTDGQNGADGKDGNTPFIGENGNWWIGTNDTGVKAEGRDGAAGEKGDTGEKGEKGEKGDTGEKGDQGEKGEKGDAGQNGSCSGYYYAEASVPSVLLQYDHAAMHIYQKINKGGLISSYNNAITLKKGHIYYLIINGSVDVMSNENNGNYSIQMTDGYDDGLCREATRIKRDGKTLATGYEQHSIGFCRMYDATENDITLQFYLEQSAYNTHLRGFKGTITITALD